MSLHNSVWITIFSHKPADVWQVIEKLNEDFSDSPYVICTFKEYDYNLADDMEFLSHVLNLANMLLDIKHTHYKPIIVCDVSLAYIKKRMENFQCSFIGQNIDELFSNRRITTNLRHNSFIFFPDFQAKTDYQNMNLSTKNSCTTSNVSTCIEEATRYIKVLLSGDLKQDEYPEFHSLVPPTSE